METNEEQWHVTTPVRTKALALIPVLLSCFIAACTLPFQSTSLPPPPPPGQILYVLVTSHPAQPKPQSTISVTYNAVALRSSSGQRLWQSAAETLPAEDAGEARIVSGGSVLYVSISGPQTSGRPSVGVKGRVIALDARSGKALWKVGLDGVVIQRLAVAANGNLYLQVDKRVEALDGASGAQLWSASTDASYYLSQLIVTKSAVYVEQEANFLPGSQQGNTYDSVVVRALGLNDGREIWRREVANTDRDGLLSLVRVSMQADEQVVYLLREGQVQETHGLVTGLFPRTTLFALNARDGSPRWSNQTQHGDAWQDFDLFLSGQTLYVRGVASPGLSSMSAFQRQNGARLWTWQAPFVLSPVEPPDHIYGSSINKGESLCALRESDGSKAWCANYNQAGPVLFGRGRIYLVAFKVSYQGSSVSETPAQLYFLNESDGSLIAQYSPGDERTASIAGLALS